MDVCVRSVAELVPVWLGMLGVVHLVVKTGLHDISPDPNHRTTTRLLYVATA
jgi:hypothetical protein